MPVDKKDHNSYMDGVPVKISEKYKRRPIVRLPHSCQNCSPGPALYEKYNFDLERSTLLKLNEWKKLREEQASQMASKANYWYQREEENEKLNMITFNMSNSAIGSNSNVVRPNTGKEILLPTNACETKVPVVSKQNSFKISDFETDNSSPFDNVELKTINEMEVLASVLSTDQLKNESTSAIPSTSNGIIDGHYISKSNGPLWNEWNSSATYASPPRYYEPSHYSSQLYDASVYNSQLPAMSENWMSSSFVPPRQPYASSVTGTHTTATNLPYSIISSQSGIIGNNVLQAQKNNSKSVPDLALELESEMRAIRRLEQSQRMTKTPPPRHSNSGVSVGLEDWKPWPDIDSPRHNSTDDVLAVNIPVLARNISEMGFPLQRVLRSLEKFNGDDKKVVEFLLQVERLEEKKFKGELVERALHSNNYNEAETEKHLTAAAVLLDLGFNIDAVEEVLLESKNDRDVALERLIS